MNTCLLFLQQARPWELDPMPKLRGKSAPASPAAPAPSETAFWVLAHWRQSRVPRPGCVEGMLMPAPHVTAPPGRCRHGQQKPRCRNASLQTLAQGLSTFLSPSGAVQVEGRREEVRVSPQWQSQPAASSTSIKMNPRMLPEVGEGLQEHPRPAHSRSSAGLSSQPPGSLSKYHQPRLP